MKETTGPRFFTKDGMEVPAVTTDEMREIDRLAMEETGPNFLQMMENAGRSFALLAIELLGKSWNRANFLVLAGGGGNGGGGICAARHLANRNVRVRLYLAEPDHMSEAAQWQRNTFRFAGGVEVNSADLPNNPDVVLDALVGYGLRFAPRQKVAEMISWTNSIRALTIALDVPSGVDANTGDVPGVAINPSATMTLALPKTGLLPKRTRDLYLADLGLPIAVFERMKLGYEPPFGGRFYVALQQRAQ